MKKLILGFLSLIILCNFSTAQSNFDDYIKDDRVIFQSSRRVMGTKTFDEEKFRNGYLGTVDCSKGIGITTDIAVRIMDQRMNYSRDNIEPLKLDTSRDFEIEAEIKVSGSNTLVQSGISWENIIEANSQHYFFIFNLEGKISIGNCSEYIPTKFEEHSNYINPSGYNKLTIRKVGAYFYYFINNNYITYTKIQDTNATFLTFASSNHSYKRSYDEDWIRVHYIKKAKSNYITIKDKELIWKKLEGYKSLKNKYGKVGHTLNYTPPLIPIMFTWNADEGFDAKLVRKLVTPLGTFGLDVGYEQFTQGNSLIFVFKDFDLEKEISFRVNSPAILKVNTKGVSELLCDACGVLTFDITGIKNIELELLKK